LAISQECGRALPLSFLHNITATTAADFNSTSVDALTGSDMQFLHEYDSKSESFLLSRIQITRRWAGTAKMKPIMELIDDDIVPKGSVAQPVFTWLAVFVIWFIHDVQIVKATATAALSLRYVPAPAFHSLSIGFLLVCTYCLALFAVRLALSLQRDLQLYSTSIQIY
jgi:hypothetical protein